VVEFSLNFTPIHSNTCGLMRIRLHPNKTLHVFVQTDRVGNMEQPIQSEIQNGVNKIRIHEGELVK